MFFYFFIYNSISSYKKQYNINNLHLDAAVETKWLKCPVIHYKTRSYSLVQLQNESWFITY